MFAEELLFDEGTKNITADANDERFLMNALQYGLQFSTTTTCEVMTVHALCQMPIGICIETFGEFISLVSDVRGSFEVIRFFRVRIRLLLHHDTIVAIGEHADSTCCF